MGGQTVGQFITPFLTKNNNGGGAVLGLAVVNRIIKNHDGTIHIENARGLGTTIHVFRPLVDEPIATHRYSRQNQN